MSPVLTAPKPLLLVLSAPSGGGKSTFCDRLLEDFPNLVYSVSCTTREPRGSEVDGEDYFFMTREGFLERVAKGEFLEHAVVHGNLYGTLAATVRDALAEGQSVLLDIDVAGAGQVRKTVAARTPDDPLRAGFLDIFLRPPSMGELRHRLVRRGEDAPEAIALRLKNAEEELRAAPLYRHVIVNDDLERAYAEMRDILLAAQGCHTTAAS
jgi:guanylate kinase